MCVPNLLFCEQAPFRIPLYRTVILSDQQREMGTCASQDAQGEKIEKPDPLW